MSTDQQVWRKSRELHEELNFPLLNGIWDKCLKSTACFEACFEAILYIPRVNNLHIQNGQLQQKQLNKEKIVRDEASRICHPIGQPTHSSRKADRMTKIGGRQRKLEMPSKTGISNAIEMLPHFLKHFVLHH